MKIGDKILSDDNRGFYLDKLDKLQSVCPPSKLEELQSIKKIVN